MIDVSGKKLMILGGNRETGFLVEEANLLGIRTVVVDPNPGAPSKRFASEHFELDGFDVAGIVALARRLRVDGVLVGVADVLVRPYMKICQELDLPCYASENTIAAFGSKDGFKKACAKFNILGVPGVLLDSDTGSLAIRDIEFPAIVKPVDNGGGVGIQVCFQADDIEKCVEGALQNSKSGQLMVERYMDCDDMFAYYTFVNGHAYLSATADRFTVKNQGVGSPVCLAARYPSQHTNDFLERVHPRLLKMFEGVGVSNGVLSIQFFVDQGTFYAYDPGFRLQGEAPHIHLKAINGFDHRQMLIQFALTGTMGGEDFDDFNDFKLGGRTAATFWVLLDSGRIERIEGLDTIAKHPFVTSVLQRLEVGDSIDPEMIGTERQVFARIYVVADSREEVAALGQEFCGTLQVFDDQSRDLVLEWVSPDDLI